jgi:hypothetical protein
MIRVSPWNLWEETRYFSWLRVDILRFSFVSRTSSCVFLFRQGVGPGKDKAKWETLFKGAHKSSSSKWETNVLCFLLPEWWLVPRKLQTVHCYSYVYCHQFSAEQWSNLWQFVQCDQRAFSSPPEGLSLSFMDSVVNYLTTSMSCKSKMSWTPDNWPIAAVSIHVGLMTCPHSPKVIWDSNPHKDLQQRYCTQ